MVHSLLSGPAISKACEGPLPDLRRYLGLEGFLIGPCFGVYVCAVRAMVNISHKRRGHESCI